MDNQNPRRCDESFGNHLYVFEYPGCRIVDACFSGDTSRLSTDERKALKAATEIVDTAKAQSNSLISLEKALYDTMIKRLNNGIRLRKQVILLILSRNNKQTAGGVGE